MEYKVCTQCKMKDKISLMIYYPNLICHRCGIRKLKLEKQFQPENNLDRHRSYLYAS